MSELEPSPPRRPAGEARGLRWKIWLAQGFGVGRIGKAPGTAGSVVGVAWTAILIAPGSPWIFAAGAAAGLSVSVWLCGEAERILGRDPGSVVLDEIVALPLCYLPWLIHSWSMTGAEPTPARFISAWNGWLCPLGFLLFRLFDIWKPWPVRQSQELPGGWGVTVDDVLAAAYAALALLILQMTGR